MYDCNNWIKKHGISVEDLKNEIENCQDEYLKNKLKDMLIIYQNFDKILQNNYIEENDLLNMLAQNIGNTDFYKTVLFILMNSLVLLIKSMRS